jgi:hypothetical protein
MYDWEDDYTFFYIFKHDWGDFFSINSFSSIFCMRRSFEKTQKDIDAWLLNVPHKVEMMGQRTYCKC